MIGVGDTLRYSSEWLENRGLSRIFRWSVPHFPLVNYDAFSIEW
jgi:hypothetical protein